MEIGQVRLKHLRFPDIAGRHQDGGATAALVRELGDNYEKYHEFLAREGKRLRDEFDPREYGWDLDGFGRAAARLHEIVLAESLLRVCHAHRRDGKSLGAPADVSVPLVDGRRRILSLESGRPLASDPGATQERAWKPADVRPFAHG